jgi:hypothetical protein
MDGLQRASVDYDNDNTSLENCQNENVLILFYTPGLENVGSPSDGLVVTVGSPMRSWGPFQAAVRGQTNYEKGYVERSGSWTDTGLSGKQGIRWKLQVPVETDGRLSSGMNAYLWARENADNLYSAKLQPTTKLLWDDHDNLTVEVHCHEYSLTPPFGTLKLFGFNWVE